MLGYSPKKMLFLRVIFVASACKDIKNGYRISKMFYFFFAILLCSGQKWENEIFF